MFKPMKCPHNELEYLRFKDGRRYMSLRGVVNAAYPCMTSKQWVLVWKMRTRQEALDYAREHFPEIVTGRDGSVTYYTSSGKQVPMMPKLHTDHTLEAFLVYFGTQDRPARDWRDALRKDSDRRREMHSFMERMVADRRENKARILMGMRDYQKPLIDGLSNNVNRLFGSFGNFGGIREQRRGDLARLARAYDPVPLSMRGMEGGFKRGEMCIVGSSGSNMSHMRASLEAMRRRPDVHIRPLVRVSFEDSAIDQHMNAAIESAMFRDFTTELPTLRSIAFGHGNKHPSGYLPSTEVMLNGGLSALADMFPPSHVPPDTGPKTMIVIDEVGPSESMQEMIDNLTESRQSGIQWVNNGPFDPTKVPDLVGTIAAEADLKELVGEPTNEELLDIKPVPIEEYQEPKNKE